MGGGSLAREANSSITCRANWWIPDWLDRLVPRLDHDPAPVDVKPQAA